MSCQSCDETFPTFAKLQAHCRVRQHAYFLFKCGSCDESYRRLADLNQHMNSHYPPSAATTAGSLPTGKMAPPIVDASKSATAIIKEDEILNALVGGGVGLTTGEETPTDGYESMSPGLSSYGTIGSLTPPLSPVLSDHPTAEDDSVIGEWEVISTHAISRATSVSPAPLQNSPGLPANTISTSETFSRPEMPDRFKNLLRKHFTWTCPSCPRFYPTQHGLEKHRQRKHNHDIPPSDAQVTRITKISVPGGFFDANRAAMVLDAADEAYASASATSALSNALICPLCGKKFDTQKGLTSHLDSAAKAHCFFTCSSCQRQFLTARLLKKHRTKKHEGVSQQPPPKEVVPTATTVQNESKLPSFTAARMLLEQASFECKICGKNMANENALKSHMKSRPKAHKNFKCSSCKGAFMTQEKLDAHRNTVHSGSRIEVIHRKPNFICDICGKEFDKRKALKSHVLSEAQSHSTWKCSLCDRVFIARLQLEKHQAKRHQINSNGTPLDQIHGSPSGVRPETVATEERTFTCLVCPASFCKPSAVAHHLESGCHSNFTRHHITSAVKALDIVPQITVKQITGPAEPPTIIVHEATSITWNGSEFKCFLCSKGFVSLHGLNSHLNSAAHDDKEFKCPKCKQEFILISALVQHLESRACGLAQAAEIINFYDALSAKFSNKLLTV